MIANPHFAIDEAEKQLAKLKADLESKAAIISTEIHDEPSDGDDDDELLSSRAGHDSELQEIKDQHEAEVTSPRQRYSKALQDAQQWLRNTPRRCFSKGLLTLRT
jgi:hypothetical protein